MKVKNKKIVILTIIQIILCIIIIVCAILIIRWFWQNKQNKELLNEVSNAITIQENENTDKENNHIISSYHVDFEKLKEKNTDTVAWLKVNGTNIEYPIVQSEDNSYYLTHSFDKKYNSAGWIFVDYRNQFDGTDKNIVIYGHNMRDDSMFGSLKNILKQKWSTSQENRKVTLITEKENCIYEVFSVYQIEKEDYYINTEFKDEKDFSDFLDEIKSRSIYDFNVSVSIKDRILTLSTCANNNKNRVVLHARLVI